MTDAQSITLALKGRWFGSYGLAYCPAHNNTNTPALSLSNGDGGQLLAHCHSGCDFREIINALSGLALVTTHYCPIQPNLIQLETQRSIEKTRQERLSAQAKAIWDSSLSIRGTLAETYLRKRGITCSLPDTLRFHASCWHQSNQRLPALIARVEGAERFAVHRTYLDEQANKALLSPSKAMLGSCKGGAVHVLSGGGKLVVAEGIETALSLGSGLLPNPVSIWAALSASGMAGIKLPSEPHQLIIAPDSDDKGVGKQAAYSLAHKATALGWEVSIYPAPDGMDWNDYLIKKGDAA